MKYFYVIFLTIIVNSHPSFTQDLTPAQLVQKQLDAYNQHNLEDFLKLYVDTVKIFNFPDKLLFKGKEQMKEVYGKMFKNRKDLYSTLTSRTVLGNAVIDKEYVIFEKNKPAVEVIAIYKVKKDKIIEVYFIQEE